MFERDSSAGIGYDRKAEVSIMEVAGNTGYGEVGSNSSNYHFIYSLGSEVFFEFCLVKWTDASFGDGLFVWIVVKLCEELC